LWFTWDMGFPSFCCSLKDGIGVGLAVRQSPLILLGVLGSNC